VEVEEEIPDNQVPSASEDDDSDGVENRPRLSLPIDLDETLELPPHISATLDEDITQKSIELPRRALLDQSILRDRTRLSDVFRTSPNVKTNAIEQGSSPRSASSGLSFVVGNESILPDIRGFVTPTYSRLHLIMIVTRLRIYAVKF
jgi:hypothetical protein